MQYNFCRENGEVIGVKECKHGLSFNEAVDVAKAIANRIVKGDINRGEVAYVEVVSKMETKKIPFPDPNNLYDVEDDIE